MLTLFADLEAAEISAAAMGSGIVLAQFYVGEALPTGGGTYPQISMDALLAEKVRGWLVNHWSEKGDEPATDIYQHGPNAVREKAKAEKVVQLLEEHAFICCVSRAAPQFVGRNAETRGK